MIPKLPGNKFLLENWNAEYCAYFDHWKASIIKDDIIGWCKASQVFCRPRNDREYIAIMLEDNTWCHMPLWMITDPFDRYDNFETFSFEGLDKSLLEEYNKSERGE
jgi:hypothetical protein